MRFSLFLGFSRPETRHATLQSEKHNNAGLTPPQKRMNAGLTPGVGSVSGLTVRGGQLDYAVCMT
jgi:hypothetical protein